MKRLLLILALALPSLALGAVQTTTVQGKILMPSGSVATGGTIIATLSGAGTTDDLSTAASQRVGGRVVGSIGASGDVTGLVLVPNDAITPAGTYYDVSISATGPVRTSWTERWSVTTSPDPVAIGAITRLDSPPSLSYNLDNASDVVITSLSNNQCLKSTVPPGTWENKLCTSTTAPITWASGDVIGLKLWNDESGGTPVTSSPSGLQTYGSVLGGGVGLSLLTGCADGQTLRWDAVSTEWDCATGGPSLTSATTTAGDTLTLTSDGTNLTLTPSRAAADVIVVDQAGVEMIRIDDSTEASSGGVDVSRHMAVGQDASVESQYVFNLAEKGSQKAFNQLAYFKPTFNTDVGISTADGLIIEPTFATGFDCVSGCSDYAGMFINFVGDAQPSVAAPMAGTGPKLKGLDIKLSPTVVAGTPAWPELSALFIRSPVINGVAPTVSYGIKVEGAGNGTSAFAASFGGRVQIHSNAPLGFGQTQGTIPINLMRAKTSTGTSIVMALNSVTEYEWSPTSFFPSTNGGAGLGQDGGGFSDIWFLDTSATFEDRIVFTSSTALTADRVLTIDMTNADRTLRLPVGSTGVATNGSLWWGDSSDAFDTGTEVCTARSLSCLTTHTVAGVNQTCAFDHGTVGTYFYAMCY